MVLPRIGIVILTYNSHEDLRECLRSLSGQINVVPTIIVVDNNSEPSSRKIMENDFVEMTGGTLIANARSLPAPGHEAYFLRNDINSGYSAGNNIGARLAVALGCDAVLIANPDVRFQEPNYLENLYRGLLCGPSFGVAASRVINLDGKDENPMAELGFVEELLWPFRMILSRFIQSRSIAGAAKFESEDQIAVVEKVSGCCFLISSDALQRIQYFDEETFLYCEESILSSKLKANGLAIVYVASSQVLHAHDRETKGRQGPRYAAWSRSRAYYHRAYTGYGPIARRALAVSRWLTLKLIRFREGALDIKSRASSAETHR